ncbi:molybdate ABC transporter substrate-binding protein [Bacillus sp. T33-2]|nr:molybdate ABC transporter substrate-binding protein [Bacillus sp. T33-2]
MLLLLFTSCNAADNKNVPLADQLKKTQITVSAAASMQDALNEIANQFAEEHPEIDVVYNFGGSGALQQQIVHGAPVDVFISADKQKFIELVDEQLIKEDNAAHLAGNELVIVVNSAAGIKLNGLDDLANEDVMRIGIGTPETVPAGKYARESLEAAGLWNEIKGKMIPAKDVRQVLTYVETQSVDAGLVYNTDALMSDKVNIAVTAPSGTHEPIVYPAGLLESSKHKEQSRLFLQFLQGQKALKIFRKYGFKALD